MKRGIAGKVIMFLGVIPFILWFVELAHNWGKADIHIPSFIVGGVIILLGFALKVWGDAAREKNKKQTG